MNQKMEGEEVEVDLNKKDNKSEKSTADVERVEPEKPKQAELDLEVEEEDDTPLEDQGKEPLPKDMVRGS